MSQQDDRTLISKAKVEAPARDERCAVFELVKGPGAPLSFRLSEAAMIVGRDPGVDLAIESRELSRKHLRIMKVGEEHMCVDLGSVNGVYLNGVKIHSAVLRDGDQVQLADTIFIYRGLA